MAYIMDKYFTLLPEELNFELTTVITSNVFLNLVSVRYLALLIHLRYLKVQKFHTMP